MQKADLQHIGQALADQMTQADAEKALTTLRMYVPGAARSSQELFPAIRNTLLLVAKIAGQGSEVRAAFLEYIHLTDQEQADELSEAEQLAKDAGVPLGNATKKKAAK
jgi:hypothetical protein